MSKQIQNPELVIQSLLNLRAELIARGESEIVFKINSCLYSEYPHANHASSWIGVVDRQSGAFTQDEIDNATAWR